MKNNSPTLRQDAPAENKPKVTVSGLISLIVAILIFSGVFKGMGNFLAAFDYTTLAGAFGTIGEGGQNYLGSGGNGARYGFMFAVSFLPNIMLAIGLVKVVDGLRGLECAAALLTPILRFIMGIPGIAAVTLVTSISAGDAGAAMTREMSESGQLTENERDIFVAFQYPSSGMITNYFSCGPALFDFIPCSTGLPLAVCFITKIIGANLFRFVYLGIIAKFTEKEAA